MDVPSSYGCFHHSDVIRGKISHNIFLMNTRPDLKVLKRRGVWESMNSVVEGEVTFRQRFVERTCLSL